jgi:hypothetical protein
VSQCSVRSSAGVMPGSMRDEPAARSTATPTRRTPGTCAPPGRAPRTVPSIPTGYSGWSGRVEVGGRHAE